MFASLLKVILFSNSVNNIEVLVFKNLISIFKTYYFCRNVVVCVPFFTDRLEFNNLSNSLVLSFGPETWARELTLGILGSPWFCRAPQTQ